MRNKTRKFLLVLLGVFIFNCVFVLASSEKETDGNSEGFKYQFRINTIKQVGLYEGDTTEGKPSGYGKFTAEEPNYYVYEGEFESGTFEGEGQMVYENGDCLEGKFKSGVPEGKCKLTHTDGSYEIIRYRKGVARGPLVSYSADDEVIGKDYYYDGERVSKWIETSKEISYRDLYEHEDEYYGSVLKLNCKVVNVYENLTACHFKVVDENNQIYWGVYSNNIQQEYNQSVMPSLKVGDELELYGFYRGILTYSCPNDDEDFGYSYPNILPIIGETKDFDLDYAELSCDYDEVMRFPYHYYLTYTTITGTVDGVIYKDNEHAVKVKDAEGNVYYCILDELMALKEDVELPLPGDKIRYRGRFMGLYKESSSTSLEEDLKIFVAMKATSLKIQNEG